MLEVNDTCVCGCEFHARGDNGYNQVSNRHNWWLDKHAECRASFLKEINAKAGRIADQGESE
jgi:hypothetical protein